MSHYVIWSLFSSKRLFQGSAKMFFLLFKKILNLKTSFAFSQQEPGGWLVNTLIVKMHILMNFPHYSEKLQLHCTSPHR